MLYNAQIMALPETSHQPRLTDPAELFEPEYWQTSTDGPMPDKQTSKWSTPSLAFHKAALVLFNKHVGLALNIPSFSNEPEPVHQEVPSGRPVRIDKLPLGTLVIYDTERLVQNDRISKRYPEQVVDTSMRTHSLNRVNNLGSDFVSNQSARLKQPKGSKIWVPSSLVIIPNDKPGKDYREYVREGGIAMVLPGKKNQPGLFRPDYLYHEAEREDEVGSPYWQPVSLPVNPIIEHTNWVPPTRRRWFDRNSSTELLPQRLRGAWLYQDSAVELARAEVPAPTGFGTELLVALARTGPAFDPTISQE